MTVRFCDTCHSEVEETEGHCLLGHSVRLDAVTTSLDDLRTEVDSAFDEASFRVATVVVEEGETPKGQDAAPVVSLSAPPPPPPPPPPPSGDVRRPSYQEMWAALDKDAETSGDPIADFAPPPRMDWGPKRSIGLARLGRTRTKTA